VHARVSDHAGSDGCSRWRSRPFRLPHKLRRQHPGLNHFRGSMAGLHNPLPTLHRRPRGRRCTAWGRRGSLVLHRGGLSPPTPCRSPGAQLIDYYGGEGGIRTHGRVAPAPVFKTGAFNRSATSPEGGNSAPPMLPKLAPPGGILAPGPRAPAAAQAIFQPFSPSRVSCLPRAPPPTPP
jgi:hypothetical protein